MNYKHQNRPGNAPKCKRRRVEGGNHGNRNRNHDILESRKGQYQGMGHDKLA
jgi:hypothetical protein